MKSLTVIPFDFGINTIRAITDEHGEPWFIAKDVFDTLGIAWRGADSLSRINPTFKRSTEIPYHPYGVKETWIIKEPAVYKLAFRSNKPEAERFTDWLAEEVLPSIRKTGQYNRMINQFLLEEPRDWERRFPPEYYQALCGLFGWTYTDHTALPDVIGQITRRWVYGVCLPIEVLEELDARRGSQKLHQWVNADAGKRLFAQIDAVTLIAKQSIDYKDFDARCKFLWGKKGHQLSFLFPMAAPLGRRQC